VAGLRLGHYRLIEQLGKGCQGQVWRALQVEPIVDEVALKLLTPAQARQPGWRSQFHREAIWGARLSSPSILPTYEFGAAAGYLYLSMPLVVGDSLAEVIARRRHRRYIPGWWPDSRHWLQRLSDEDYGRAVVKLVARVARAVAVAHAGRVVHRDIKPANILVDRRSLRGVFLCDFGLARDLDDAWTLSIGGSTGTPLYMAPERLLGQPADDTLCDVYSLGVTLAEAVTLENPFKVPRELPPSEWPRYLAHCSPVLHREAAWLPQALEASIRKAMSRNPGGRFASMAVFADDLERLSALGAAAQPDP
jgi:serine/threonine protein kinase